ncbi:hypothetical protein [Ornithinimicrobium kibberense]
MTVRSPVWRRGPTRAYVALATPRLGVDRVRVQSGTRAPARASH